MILRCLAYNEFTAIHQERIIEAIHDAAGTYSFSVVHNDDDLIYLRSLLVADTNSKFKVVINAALQLVNSITLAKPTICRLQLDRSHFPVTVNRNFKVSTA